MTEKLKKLPHGAKVRYEGTVCVVLKRHTIRGTVTRLVCVKSNIPMEVL